MNSSSRIMSSGAEYYEEWAGSTSTDGTGTSAVADRNTESTRDSTGGCRLDADDSAAMPIGGDKIEATSSADAGRSAVGISEEPASVRGVNYTSELY